MRQFEELRSAFNLLQKYKGVDMLNLKRKAEDRQRAIDPVWKRAKKQTADEKSLEERRKTLAECEVGTLSLFGSNYLKLPPPLATLSSFGEAYVTLKRTFSQQLTENSTKFLRKQKKFEQREISEQVQRSETLSVRAKAEEEEDALEHKGKMEGLWALYRSLREENKTLSEESIKLEEELEAKGLL